LGPSGERRPERGGLMNDPVYLNGQFLPYDEAKVPVEDRGYQFGDGIYEVIRVYNGHGFRMDGHFERLKRSADAIFLDVDVEKIQRDAGELIGRSSTREASIYIQITRGVAMRYHPFPAECQPTVVMVIRPASAPADSARENGVSAITLPDDRWARCYIKSINLLPNILAKQQAVQAGAYEALYLRDGYLTEGSSSNAYAVLDGTLWTYPKSNYILGGITRDVVLEIARADGIEVREEPVSLAQLRQANEVMVSSSTAEIVPVVSVDGRDVGGGKPGPVFERLHRLFQYTIDDECQRHTS
jgi:D-alanine transaminase